jgi:signal transduction histidine kinase
MSLKWKFAILFVGLGAVPVLVGAYLLLARTEASFEASFAERSASIERQAKRRLDAIAGELERALIEISADPVVDSSLLGPLSRGRFYEDPEVDYERTIVREARRLMTSAVLDTLRLVDLGKGTRRGHVIALGHRMGFEPDDPELLPLLDRLERDGRLEPALRLERVDNQTGGTDAVWTLQVLHVAQSPEGARVALVGGRIVDARLLEDLRMSSLGAEIALDDRTGARVAATFEGREPPVVEGGYAMATRPLLNPGSAGPVAALKVYISKTELSARKAELWRFGGLVLGATFILALFLAIVSANRIARPLAVLARATGDIAFGRRDVTVPERRGRDELAQLTRAFNQMTRDLLESEERLRKSERIAAWREIARRIAHEIKNPLSPIQLSLETLRKAKARQLPQFDGLFDELTETMLEEVARMTRIVSAFSDFARMPAPRLVDIDLVELATQVLALFRETVPGCALTLDAPAELEHHVDPDQLRQVLINLVKNGLEAIAADPARSGKGRGRLEIQLRREGEEVILGVADDGAGMTAESQAQLFTPYFTTKTNGTGLGLAIVLRVVEEHGGSIRVASTPGVGTRFEVRLPRRAPDAGPATPTPVA